MRLLVGIPLYVGYESQGLASLIKCLLYTKEQMPDLFIDVYTPIREIYFRAQSKIVKRAVRGHFDYLFFTEEDHVLREDTLLRLINDDLPVCSAAYVDRSGGHHPIFARKDEKDEWKAYYGKDDDEIIEVDMTGMGALLLKREVFEKLFEFDFLNGPYGFPGDWALSSKLKELGYKIYVDLRAEIGHIGAMKPVYYLKDSIPLRRQ
jgi:hypothetical protein